MKVEIIEDSKVLIPNKEHKNFTESDNIIEKGTVINGEPKSIQGLRRGEPFDYKLFLTENKQLIHIKKTKEMGTTEVALGVDAKQTTILSIPNAKELFTKHTIGGALIGAGAGYYFSAKYKSMDKKSIVIYTVGGAIAGLLSGRYFEKKQIIVKQNK